MGETAAGGGESFWRRKSNRAGANLAREQAEANDALLAAAEERAEADEAKVFAERERAVAERVQIEARRERAEANEAALNAARELAEMEGAARDAARARQQATDAKAKVVAVERSLHAANGNEEREIIARAIRDIFHNYNPRKLADVDELVEQWQGEERLLLAKVRAKYLPEGAGHAPKADDTTVEAKHRKRWWQRRRKPR